MDIILSNSSDEPIYQQIISQIKAQIMNGTLTAGDALPSMRVLAAQLQISVITTKRAYEELERDGYTYSVPGKGCFVCSNERLAEEEKKRLLSAMDECVEALLAFGFSRDALIARISKGGKDNA